MKYLALLFFFALGCSKQSHSPCDDIDASTKKGRIEKSECQIGEWCLKTGRCKDTK